MSHLHQVYDRAFYAEQVAGSVRSAAAVVPQVLSLFPHVTSVVDVGCGTGTWLHQFQLHGVRRVLGIDGGDPTEEFLHIRKDEFLRCDLSGALPVSERFDLAMSVEVAEHLDAVHATRFVDNLVALGDIVVFGAAIPGQGGTQHVNEQWASYWAALFRERGYRCFDVLRRKIWYDERVEWWYRQNLLVFVREGRADLVTRLMSGHQAGDAPLDLVHPRCFEVYRTSQEQQIAQPDTMAPPANPPGEQVPAESTMKLMSELIELRSRLGSIERSAGWRTILALRRIVTPVPGLRAMARGAARAVARLAERDASRDGRG